MLAMELRMVRGAFAVMLEMDSDLTVVGEADKAQSVLRTAQRCRPDVVVLDADMIDGSAITVAADLHAHMPTCRTLLIAARKSPELLRRAMKANASGLLLKDSPAGELVRGIKAVAAGEQIVDQELAIAALNARPNPLSKREVDILVLVAAGAEPAEIAKKLDLSIGTVRNYLASIVTKLDARNRVDAIRIADEFGWLLPAVEPVLPDAS
ncbi:response regulator transcription factor [Sphaerisporangium sp. TRM90804]|uniref:response regulator transcription factor n=1 Tax=Sphaerisporangium sp. TRM90804 TaxID=3031113 RepID=UPI00244CEDD8|nr:response regulator transcription factor [Sphaerisporangium sp. TRM90804]MDH2427314.1 response regulator transcription factor [Sphaerisporangium sp. TRM90804]